MSASSAEKAQNERQESPKIEREPQRLRKLADDDEDEDDYDYDHGYDYDY